MVLWQLAELKAKRGLDDYLSRQKSKGGASSPPNVPSEDLNLNCFVEICWSQPLTSLFSTLSLSTGSSVLLASIKSPYLSAGNGERCGEGRL